MRNLGRKKKKLIYDFFQTFLLCSFLLGIVCFLSENEISNFANEITINNKIYKESTTEKKLSETLSRESNNIKATKISNSETKSTSLSENKVYLSDLNYITENNWTYNGWSGHKVEHDKNQDGGRLSLILDGKQTYFTKGISIHAKGQATYDISELSTKYPRFIAYIGVDAARGSNGNLWIKISISKDGKEWVDKVTTTNMNGKTPSVAVDINIEGYKYIRFYVDPIGGNGADHATIGNPRLITKDFDQNAPYYNKLQSVAYYDNILKNYSVEENYSKNYRLVLERELVNKLGYSTIQEFAEFNKNAIKTLNWYLAKNERIEQIIEVGEISNPLKFLEILADLYTENETEFNSNNRLIYTKMAVGLAATYTTDGQHSPLRFSSFASTYDYVERFSLMKKLFDENKFMRIENNTREGKFIPNDWFEDLHVELIRMIMHDNINSEEIIWLNEYTHYKNSLNEFMIPYIHPNYSLPKLYDEANRDTYNSKYLLNQYNVPFADGKQRLWMVLEAGGICWNQSRFGQTMYRVNGLPAVGAYQPSHEMYFNYAQDKDGNGYWIERYGNYNGAGTTWYGGNRYRLIFNWGNKPYAEQIINDSKSGTSLGYLYLGQANLNNYNEYKKSLYYNLIANSYADNNKKIETYLKAIEVNNINLDSFDYILNLYKQMSDKNPGGTITSDEWYDLALKVTDSYKFYPVAMYDLLKVIRPYLEGEKKLDIDAIEKRNLTEAVNVSDKTLASIGAVNAGSGVRTHAKRLLGLAQPDPLTFSFDGENARKIVKNPIYALNWAYSLDGGLTYSAWTDEDYASLSQKEINSITQENDIKIKFMGLKDYIFTIDITKGTLPTNLYPNDLENKVIGVSDNMEWQLQDSDSWTPFEDKLPDLTGNKTVKVRTGFTGKTIPSTSTTYTFALDNQPPTAKYIPIEHLSIHSYSTQSQDAGRPFYALNAIDGNMNTLWHTDFKLDVRNDNIKPFISIKLDSPRNISALEFAQIKYKNNDPDFIKDVIVYVSSDGESWVEVGRLEGCTQENKLRKINFEHSAYGQYVKIEMNTYSMFASLAMVNLYEDTTVKTVGTFSFDGANAGKIMLVDEFKGNSFEYSLDGGTNWKKVKGDETKLSSYELQELNVKDNIKIRIKEKNIVSTISISKQKTPVMPNNLYLNDLENRLIGLSDINRLEWKIDDGKWTSYIEKEPIVTGTRKLYIRNKATGNIAASDALEYQFTEDNQPETSKYIPIKHLTVHDFSSETVRTGNQEQAVKAIDGNNNTKWHTSRTATNDEKFIVIKLDEARYISKIQYNKEANYVYGVPKNGIVSISMDGENWKDVLVFENLYNPSNKAALIADSNQKDIILDESVLAQYVKIKVTKSCDYVNGAANGIPYDYFFSSTMLNFFEDTTKNAKVPPTAEIQYSTTKPTNKNVEVSLINPSKEITVTNNGGKITYTFTENGTFTFEFVDHAGNKGTAVATVDWIDKKEIKADVAYNINKKTNQNVTATIAFNKENVTVKGGNTHTFTENGTYTFEYVDEAGNKGTKVAKVNWIDKKAPVATIKYSTEHPTNQNVVATITFNKENVTVKDGNTYTFISNGIYMFEYIDEAGNKGTVQAKVDWIDKTLPQATIIYNITSPTNKDVIATITFDKADVIVKGGNTHTFTENGEYEFEFTGPAGNKGTMIAKVDWIDKKVPIATITYSTKHPTNQNVIATITFDKKNVEVKGGNTHTFTENGTYTFEFTGPSGNKGTAQAKVDWIDKTLPKATITYNINKLTNKDVIATITFDKENVIVKDGNTHTFTENGEYEFEFTGPAGNKGTMIAKVSWIDKKIPVPTVTYSTIKKTNEDVIATVTFDKTNVEVKGGNTHTFTENGEYIFEYTDKVGNKGQAVAIVSWIDKKVPIATVTYSTTEPTNKDVVATIKFDKEISYLTTTSKIEELGNNTYKAIIDKNIDFTLEFIDTLGNKGSKEIHVDWIDKVVPTAKIKYSKTTITTENVLATLTDASEDIKITNNNGKNTYTFTENGTFTFEFVDKAGNKGAAKAEVNNIDKNAQAVEIEYSTTKPTNKDVVATLKSDAKINITNNNGKNTYTFTKNGDFTFQFIDGEGNQRSMTANVTNIDKITPTATIISDIATPTNSNVVVRLINPSEEITITNNNGKNTYTFTENGTYTFEFVDKAGNKGTAKATTTNIDKKAPIAKVKYSTIDPTNKDVIVTLSEASEDIKITNNNGKNTYTFTENGIFIFEFVDKAGNKGTVEARVNWIDKTLPKATITYNLSKLTNKDVVATVTFDKENVEVNGGNTHTFTENGEYVFEFTGPSGNEGTVIAKVDWIDKVVPTAKVEYSTIDPTNKEVVATLITSSEEITITNNNSKNTYTFTENGEFTFEFVDKAGNKGTAKAEVSNINKNVPNVEIKYSTTKPTNKEVVATVTSDSAITITNNNGKKTYTFIENGTFTFEYVDKAGNKGKIKAEVKNIDKNVPIAEIEYSTTRPTNQEVTATVTFNKANVQVKGGNTHIFTENGEYIFEFVDEAGNKGTAKAEVNCIDKRLPVAEINYSKTTLTNEDVTVTINFDKANVKIRNNNSKNTYTFNQNGEFTFEYVDEAGNEGVVATKVDWIDKIAPTVTINYSTESETNEPVIATLNPSEKIIITNNNGKNTYIFNINGEFTFEFVDKAGNQGTAKVKVTWINEKSEKTENPSQPSTSTSNKPGPTETKPVIKQENNNTLTSQAEKTENNYSTENIEVNIITSQDLKDTDIKFNKLSLSSKLKKELGKESQYFELKLTDKSNNNVELNASSKITLKIKLDSKKKFNGIYLVKDDYTIEKMEFEYDGENNIVVETNYLSKYAISYDENIKEDKIEQEIKDNEEKEDVKSEESNKLTTYEKILIVIIVLLIFVIFTRIRKSKKNSWMNKKTYKRLYK